MSELTIVAQASAELAPIIFMGPPLAGVTAAFGVRVVAVAEAAPLLLRLLLPPPPPPPLLLVAPGGR